jgi:hypothetical protein
LLQPSCNSVLATKSSITTDPPESVYSHIFRQTARAPHQATAHHITWPIHPVGVLPPCISPSKQHQAAVLCPPSHPHPLTDRWHESLTMPLHVMCGTCCGSGHHAPCKQHRAAIRQTPGKACSQPHTQCEMQAFRHPNQQQPHPTTTPPPPVCSQAQPTAQTCTCTAVSQQPRVMLMHTPLITL